MLLPGGVVGREALRVARQNCFYFSDSVFFPFSGMLILAHVTVLHLFLLVEDGEGWSQEGSQTQTAEGVICRALQEPLFVLEPHVIGAAFLCSLEMPPGGPPMWCSEESRLRSVLAIHRLHCELVQSRRRGAGGPLAS